MIGTKQTFWKKSARTDTEVVLCMTSRTGLTITFAMRFVDDYRDFTVCWGDGTTEIHSYAGDINYYITHTYSSYGTYVMQFYGVKSIGFRYLDGQAQYNYDAAPISVVDYSGLLTEAASGAFKNAVNLVKFIAPNAHWMGQRSFAGCVSLKEVEIGPCLIYYDGTFQDCSSLESFTAKASGICWSYVWQGCTAIKQLKLGSVEQFATQDFYNTPNLMDIWISGKTVDQIKQVASGGNIKSGYGATFPWSANAGCRFHGDDGIVLGNGTVVD